MAVLVHGADRSAVYDLCQQAVRKVTGTTDDAMGVVRLTEQQQDRLYEEFASVSLFGDRQVVWVSDAGDSIVKSLEPILNSGATGNLILVDADGLTKTSKLRKLFEASTHCASVALYEESGPELRSRLQRQIKAAGLEISDEAMQRLMELISFERGIGECETNKLIIYCTERSMIEVEDVDAMCGDTSEASGDDLVDAVFSGNLVDVDRFSSNVSGSRSGLSLALQHATKLQAMALQVSQGMSIDSVVNSPRFGIFFKRRSAISAQLKVWNLATLLDAEERICSAILLTRELPDLEETIVNRTLLALGRSARLR